MAETLPIGGLNDPRAGNVTGVSEHLDWQGRTIAGTASARVRRSFSVTALRSPLRCGARTRRRWPRDYTVHTWDMPGYGRSSKSAEHRVDFGSQAQTLVALLEHWDLGSPHVIAHDFGGAVSLRAHLVLGAPYASLMLVDVVAIPPSGSPFFRFVKEHPTVLGELPAYIHEAIVRTLHPGRHPPRSERGAGRPARRAVARRGRPARVLPADRRLRRDVPGGERADPRATRDPGAGALGRRRRVDPGRDRPPPRQPPPVRVVSPRGRRRSPDAVRRARRAR